MRKIYILTDDENNEAVLDALEARGIEDPDELENPRCPLCGSDTLLAYSEDDEYTVLTWHSLSERERHACPDAWFLICQEFTCTYEEQVEHVLDPAGAEIFDLDYSHRTFDEYAGIISRRPSDMKELITFLDGLRRQQPQRKLDDLLDEAQWRYEDEMRKIRTWIHRIPTSRRISFDTDNQHVTATFVAAAGDTILVRTEPKSEMVAVKAEDIWHYSPRHFPAGEPDPPREKERDLSRMIWAVSSREYVVVDGYPLVLHGLERFGLYYVSTTDPNAASAVGLKEHGQNCWTGLIRRSRVQGRYISRKMLRVRGY